LSARIIRGVCARDLKPPRRLQHTGRGSATNGVSRAGQTSVASIAACARLTQA
jgi:hypothetical protein